MLFSALPDQQLVWLQLLKCGSLDRCAKDTVVKVVIMCMQVATAPQILLICGCNSCLHARNSDKTASVSGEVLSHLRDELQERQGDGRVAELRRQVVM